MTGLARLVACGTLLVACTPFAHADSFQVTGFVNFDQNSLSFAPPFATQNDTGIFAPFANGTVNYLLGTVAYTNGFPQTTEAITITGANGDVLAFYAEVNSPIKSTDAAGNLQVALNETGYYTFNGGPAQAGTFDLNFDGTTPNGSATDVQFTATGALSQAVATGVTPEPNSMLLLGTGLLGSAAFLRRRRA